jgi:uncharacterized membrane protein YdjX (TVP38/TMEM64 family)
MNYKRLLKIGIIILAIYGLKFLFHKYQLDEYTKKENLQAFISSFGNWIPLAYLTTFTFAMLINIPASVFLIVIGTLCGPIWGSLWGIIGCYVASVLLFFISKKSNVSEKIKSKMGSKWLSFNKNMEEKGSLYLAGIRSLSLLPFSLISYASGVTDIKTKDFIKGTVVGCIPQIIIYNCSIPMILSKNYSTEALITTGLWTLVWLTLFALEYKSYLKISGIAADLKPAMNQ